MAGFGCRHFYSSNFKLKAAVVTSYNMKNSDPIITLLTDFGERDGFVGTMKGVILGIVPHAQLVDLSHLIAPQAVRQAAFVLMTSTPFFPEGTVHLVVVDPGVGSARRPVAVRTERAFYVAPDNGVLSFVLAQTTPYDAVELSDSKYRLPKVSRTFHGRDVFSPAAAHLAAGVPLEELGPSITDLRTLPLPKLEVERSRIKGEVLNVDHFGNVRTSILYLEREGSETLLLRPLFATDGDPIEVKRFSPVKARIVVGSLTIDAISNTFSDVGIGAPVAYVGSEGGLEVALNQGNLAEELNIQPGDPVEVFLQE
jgi:S-adenosylmethionine hydrolase